jgi:hypothetical protein
LKSLLSGLALLALLGCRGSGLGNVQDAELRLSATELDFGDVYLGALASLSVDVTNVGKHDQEVQLSVEPPFDTPASLEVPGISTVSLHLTFLPTTSGDFTATLPIGTRSLQLHGRALDALVCSAPNSCTDARFDPTAGMCVETAKADGLSCGTACVTNGSCAHGACLGKTVSCDDKNACTDDGCSEASGCMHVARQCAPSTTNRCRVAGCDPLTGCLLVDADDGIACGPRDCHTNRAQICITGQCVYRPLPSRECLSLSGYLKASTANVSGGFGGRIAVSADGDTLAVGATGEPSDSTGVGGNQLNQNAAGSGAVYVFHRQDGVWMQQAYLKASNTGAGDAFGYSVALSSDGNALAVGAHLEDSSAVGVDGDQLNDDAHDSGAVYVFVRLGSSWTQQAYLKASNTGAGDYFGASVAISGDGNALAVAATAEDSNATGSNGNQLDNSALESGAVYFFRRIAGGWLPTDYLKAPNTGAGDQLGFGLALSTDGATIAIGAPGEDSKAVGVNGNPADNSASQSGAVYLYRQSPNGWVSDAYLKASNTGAGDAFGISVSLSADGTTVAIGAYGEDSGATGIGGDGTDNSASQSGAVYVYQRLNGAWAPPTYLKASNTRYPDDFGFSVSLSGDGKALLVGAWGENSGANGIDGDQADTSQPHSGAAFLFRRAPAGWLQQAYVKASNTAGDDLFGYHVAISSDATTLAIGANGEDSAAVGIGGNQNDDSASESGASYVYSAP